MSFDRSARRENLGICCALGISLAISGCALSPRFGPPPLAGPPRQLQTRPTPSATNPALAGAAPDSTQPGAVSETGEDGVLIGTPSPGAPAAGPRRPSKPVWKLRDAVADSVALAARADSIARASAAKESSPPPALSVDLPEAERARLETKALQDLDACEALVVRLERQRLSTDGAETLRTVRGLMQQSRAALAREDLRAAANLAHKARLLALEVIPVGG